MAYDEKLAERVRKILGPREDVSERKMFGGIAFMVAGRMACGVLKDDLLVRLSVADGEQALTRPHVRPMDFTGKPMAGFLYIAPGGTKGAALSSWVARGAAYAVSQPPKKQKARSKPRPRPKAAKASRR